MDALGASAGAGLLPLSGGMAGGDAEGPYTRLPGGSDVDNHPADIAPEHLGHATVKQVVLEHMPPGDYDYTDVTQPGDVAHTYAANLQYRLDCLQSTTLGRSLAAASFPLWTRNLLQRYSKLQSTLYHHYGYVALAAIPLGAQIISTGANVSPIICGVVMMPVLIFLCLTFVLDVMLLLLMEPAMSVAWEAAFMAQVPDGSTGEYTNKFLKINVATLEVMIRSHFSRHPFAKYLRRFRELRMMLYTPRWRIRNVPFVIGLCDCWTALAGSYPERYFWLLTAGIIDIGATVHIAFNVPGLALLYGLTPAILWLFILVMVNLGMRTARTAMSLLLCFLPDLLFHYIRIGVQRRVMARAIQILDDYFAKLATRHAAAAPGAATAPPGSTAGISNAMTDM